MLTGLEIENRMREGQIVIRPYDKANLNPNSYNLSLGSKLLCWHGDCRIGDAFDAAHAPPAPDRDIDLDGCGFLLRPGNLYLAETVEYTETHGSLVPCLQGRSSLARLGLEVHRTAGFGDTGFEGHWTLEMTVVRPLWVYGGMKVCQVYYLPAVGEVTPYRGKYRGQTGPTASRMSLEMTEGTK